MFEQVTSNIYGLLKFVFLCPLAGFMMTVCLFKILESLQSDPDYYKLMPTAKKVKCWIYLSIFAGSIGLLVQSFS